jgi:hypothetical protein
MFVDLTRACDSDSCDIRQGFKDGEYGRMSLSN